MAPFVPTASARRARPSASRISAVRGVGWGSRIRRQGLRGINSESSAKLNSARSTAYIRVGGLAPARPARQFWPNAAVAAADP